MQSRLNLTYEDLQSKVAYHLGYGRDPSSWSDDAAESIEDCIRSGLRRFYFPAPVSGEMHEWSFLRPTRSITFTSGTYEYDLPDDFGHIHGDLTYTASTVNLCARLPVVGEGMIRQLRGDSASATGKPTHAAIRPKRVDHTQPQRWELIVFPTPDSSYTAEYSCSIAPDALFAARPHPYGGAEHAETILEACLMVAEERVDDMQGVHASAYAVQLATSFALDRRKRPRILGYNGDGSVYEDRPRHGEMGTITYNGVAYS